MNQKEIGKHSVKALWSSFLEKNPDNKNKEVPISFYFCDNKICKYKVMSRLFKCVLIKIICKK